LVDSADLSRWWLRMIQSIHESFRYPSSLLSWSRLLTTKYGVQTEDEIVSLSPQDGFAADSSPDGRGEHFTSGYRRYVRTYVGQVSEGDSLVHVLYREVMESPGRDSLAARSRLTSLRVLTCRRAGTGWWIVLPRGSEPVPPGTAPLSEVLDSTGIR
jgi:hypothetical protein